MIVKRRRKGNGEDPPHAPEGESVIDEGYTEDPPMEDEGEEDELPPLPDPCTSDDDEPIPEVQLRGIVNQIRGVLDAMER